MQKPNARPMPAPMPVSLPRRRRGEHECFSEQASKQQGWRALCKVGSKG